jgi:hypothetical protein
MSSMPPPPPPPGSPPPSGGYPPGGYPPSGWNPGWQQQPSGPKPANYLVWAILTTLFCCLPFGVVSIVFAAQVDGKYNSGDYAGAVTSSEAAKKWATVAAVSSLVLVVLYFLFFAVIFGASSG